MAIRIRHNSDGSVMALCAAQNEEQPGDLYLDDAVHHALTEKFDHDFAQEGLIKKAGSVEMDDATMGELCKVRQNLLAIQQHAQHTHDWVVKSRLRLEALGVVPHWKEDRETHEDKDREAPSGSP